MRKPVLLIFTNAAILIAIFALMSQSLFLVQRIAKAGAVKGKVQIQRAGQNGFEPLSSGMPVQQGDVLRTGSASSVELSWLDGTRWKLQPNSEVSVSQASYNSTNRRQISRLHLVEGKVLVRIAPELTAGSSFEVETPTALATSHGKVFSVGIDSGFTKVNVFNGQVRVGATSGGPEIQALPNKTAIETARGWISEPNSGTDEFVKEAEFLRPSLEVRVKPLDAAHVLFNGSTEVGAQVLIGGKKIPVLGTGVFVRRVKIAQGEKSWKVESIDRYGERSFINALLPPPTALTCP